MAKSKNKVNAEKKVELYETTAPLLEAIYGEIQTLSKKKPDGTLNQNKVKLINRLLTDIKTVISSEKADKYLDLINDEELPQYSDVVLILSQYSAAMRSFYNKYYTRESIHQDFRWFTEDIE
ncbi:hypothetical protein K9N50_10925 [bacterium]|nr:hypothetical protein [bacterium]